VKARNLASPQPVVRIDDPATAAADMLSRIDLRAVLVVDADGRLVGVLSDSMLLRALLPSYVEVDASLARVLEEGAADTLRQRFDGRTVADLLPRDTDEVPQVQGEDTLIEAASVMVRTRASMVGVVEGSRLIGGISIDDLLAHLLRPR
jgi:CBS domain-containing protein